MSVLTIERADGSKASATYVRHIRTLTSPSGYGDNTDLDLYRLTDGTLVVCESPANDCRATPVEREGETEQSAMFAE